MNQINQSLRQGRLLASVFTLALVSVGAQAAPPKSLTDRVVQTLLHQNTEGELYQQANNPWPGGSFKLQVFKDGEPTLTSSADRIQLQMPLRIAIVGDAANTLLKVELKCAAEFKTLGEVELTPIGPALQLQSQVSLPIPPATADCGTLQLPIQNYLQAYITQNKRQWEQQIDSRINALLSGEPSKPPLK